MPTCAFYDTKPYDRKYFDHGVTFLFHECRLNSGTAVTAGGADSVCVFVNDQLDKECLETLAGNGVKLITLRCAGFNNIDLDMAKKLGMKVVRVPAYSPQSVAEHTLALLLTLNRKIHRAFNRVRELNFSLNGLEGFNIGGRTVGIIGTGKIGKIAAQIFRGFGAEVLAYDPAPDKGWALEQCISYCPFGDLLQNSNIVSLHLPLLPETHHLLNADTLALMKPGSIVLNTSRGKLIDTTAMIQALKDRHLGGVALDVYEEEEGVFFEDLSGEVLQDDELSRLLTFPNVLITSHQAFLTEEALQEISRTTIQNILKFDKGEPFLDGTELGVQ